MRGAIAVWGRLLLRARGRMALAVRAGLLPALCGCVVLGARPALAHSVGVSRGEYRVLGSTVEAELVFAQPELATTLPGLDVDRDGSISAGEAAGAQELLARTIVEGLEVRSASGSCPGSLERVDLTEQDGLALRALYRCAGDAVLSLRLAFFDSLSLGHRHLVTVFAGAASGEGAVRAVAYEARPVVAIGEHAGGDARANGVAGTTAHAGTIRADESDSSSRAGVLGTAGQPRVSARIAAAGAVALPFFGLGLEHILTGDDHLVFLLALILVGGSLRSLLVVVTAFTVAHSLTLTLAVLGVWAPSPRLIEPAIALSIAYVGIENWFVRDATRRWMITFPFGLIHGFGFAGALQEVGLPHEQVPVALAAFNVGVEAGQVAVLVLLLPAVLWLGRRRWFAGSGLRAVSAAITVAGLCWFVSRVA